MPKPKIDAAEALKMKAAGLSHREIGILLARNVGRSLPFTTGHIEKIVRRARKQSANEHNEP